MVRNDFKRPESNAIRLMLQAGNRKSPARAWMQQAARKGDVGAKIMLSVVLMKTGTRREQDQGRRQLTALSDQGDPRAQLVLAYAMNSGLAPMPAPDAPLTLLKKAAEQGNRSAIKALKATEQRPGNHGGGLADPTLIRLD
jgi:TPR repeat protein